MAWTPPSAADLAAQARAAFRAELPESDPSIWPNNLAVVAKVLGLLLRGLYQRLNWVLRQRFALTADAEYLDGHGAEIGLARIPASYAQGDATAVTVAATTIPDGFRFRRSDQAIFITRNAVLAAGASTTLPMRALATGLAGNSIAGTVLTPEAPLAGLGATTVAAAGLTGGAEDESDESYRERILWRKRNPPHGGSPAEYVDWARQRPGVTNVFVRRAGLGPGTVAVSFMTYDATPTGIPSAGDVTAMQAHLDTLAPAPAIVAVSAPIAVTVNVTVSGLAPDTPAIRAAVTDELKAMFRRRAEPGTAAADFVFSRSWIHEAVSAAAGEQSHNVTVPAADVDCGEDEIAILGTVSFV